MSKKTIFFSIKPEFADKILDGSKTIELRRRRPNVEPGDHAVIYVSSPRCAVVASTMIEAVYSASPESIWKDFRNSCGISKAGYEEYFSGADKAHAIRFQACRIFKHQVDLERLRRLIVGFHPPQSYRYLDSSQRRILLAAAK